MSSVWGVRPCPVVSLRLRIGLAFEPFYGEVQPPGDGLGLGSLLYGCHPRLVNGYAVSGRLARESLSQGILETASLLHRALWISSPFRRWGESGRKRGPS
jgi:hypothetical protein